MVHLPGGSPSGEIPRLSRIFLIGPKICIIHIIIYIGRCRETCTCFASMHPATFVSVSLSLSFPHEAPASLYCARQAKKAVPQQNSSRIHHRRVPIPPDIYVYMHIRTYCVIRFRFTLSCSLDTAALPHPSHYNTML